MERTVVKLKYHLLVMFLMLLTIIIGVFLIFQTVTLAEEGSAEEGLVEEELAEEELVEEETESEAAVSDLNDQIASQRDKIDEINDKIEGYRANIKVVRQESVTLRNQLSILNNQVAKTDLDIELRGEEIEITKLEIERVELEIETNEEVISEDKEQLSAFVRQLDIYDQRGYLSILLSNNSFSEFFDQIKHLEGVEKSLQTTLNRVQELVGQLGKQKEELNEKRDELSELLNKLEEDKLSLGQQKNTKNYLIAQTRQSESKYQDLIGELQQEQLTVNNQVAALERRLRDKLNSGGSDNLSSLGDVNMIYPTSVRWVTAYFHDPDYPYRHLFEHSGMDYGTPWGTPLRAVESGYVAKAAYGTKWYGNYIMIIHNNNLSTLYAHLSSISVEADQYVTKGEIIGATGNSGFSSGPHLHFEVRYNGIPVNPLNYL
jgi:murein DD-endopeptidase MepM/ murein hydrolase activator NlpD